MQNKMVYSKSLIKCLKATTKIAKHFSLRNFDNLKFCSKKLT